ncbi:MAG: 2-C-methyl-D-erythritol 2,4-cyclodiphosphate synthase [Nitrospinae bacterium]|nr:2-C-methyl-D-erythritol 2,4-cyclodiphosphate synthase [Nitrospinota bacterium]
MSGIRIGHGFDVHRLVSGRKLILCGVPVPHETGLDGHSDADVATHALCDALLGAAALGDLGKHFPDTDPAYRGISSLNLLSTVSQRVRDMGYAVTNIDVTIAAEAPKLAPHIAAMRQNLSSALGVDIEQVSVKATTTEGLGYTGRREGIAAWGVALIETVGSGI